MMNRKHLFAIVCLAGMVMLSACQSMGPISAQFKMAGGNYEDAIPLYEDFLQENPEAVKARSSLGLAYLKSGRIDQAVASFEQVLQQMPGDPYATLYLGMGYVEQKAFSKALTVWDGYSDPKRPLVEAEIKRQMTLLRIIESQKSATAALAQEKDLTGAEVEPGTVAVCYFDDLSPDKRLRAFQKGLAAMVISDLSKIKSIKVVERLKLQSLLTEMKLGQTGIVDAATAPRVGRLVGAARLIVGDLRLGSIQANVSLASTTKGALEGTTSVSVAPESFFELSPAIVSDMANVMGLTLSAGELAAIGTPQTKSLKAFTFYGEALDALDSGDWAAAKDLFDKALAEDPNFGLARDGSDGCPGASSPSVGALGRMDSAVLAETVAASVEASEADQDTADAGRGASGGGGGNDGGGNDSGGHY